MILSNFCSISSLLRALAVLQLCLYLGAAFVAHADWQLVWSDEFNGTSLNTNIWWPDLGPGACINGNNELEIYTNSPVNIQVTNGVLRIIALNIGSGTNYIFTSARLNSENYDDCSGDFIPYITSIIFAQGSAIEYRAKLPQGIGCWPALWLLPYGFCYGTCWPDSGEIDVLENNGQESNEVAQNLHFYNGAFQSSESVSDVTQWHVYRLEWFTNQFNWYVDGVLGSTATNWNAPPGYSYPAPFSTNAFYIIMNLAIGGNYTGNPTPAQVATSLPAEMDIDYVRVYEQINPMLSVTQTNDSFVVSWLQQSAAWVLEQTTALSNTWSEIPVAQYQTNQNQIFFSVPGPLTNDMFYRLLQL